MTKYASSLRSEAAYRLAAELAGVIFDEDQYYAGVHVGLIGTCSEGHHRKMAAPSAIQQGGGWCRVCSKKDSVQAEINYRLSAEQAGIFLDEGQTYSGASVGLFGTCSEGHYRKMAAPTSIQRGAGWCRVCSEKDPVQAEANYRLAAELAGVIFDEDQYYAGAHVGLIGTCSEGHHRKMATPGRIQQGSGWCEECLRTADRYYIVLSDTLCKPGITGNDSRFSNHARSGLSLAHLWSGLSHQELTTGEQCILAWLREGGDIPISGKEYFDISLYPLILSYAEQVFGQEDSSRASTDFHSL